MSWAMATGNMMVYSTEASSGHKGQVSVSRYDKSRTHFNSPQVDSPIVGAIGIIEAVEMADRLIAN